MEKNIKKQKTGFDCNNLWDVVNSTGQSACVIFCAQKETTLNIQKCKAALDLAKQAKAIFVAVYVNEVDLERYGQIDQLAPAGAMSDFCDYVRNQTEDEARQVFLPLLQQAQSMGLSIALQVVSRGMGEKEFIKSCHHKFSIVHLL